MDKFWELRDNIMLASALQLLRSAANRFTTSPLPEWETFAQQTRLLRIPPHTEIPLGDREVSFIVSGGAKLIYTDGPLAGEVSEFFFSGSFLTTTLRPSWSLQNPSPFPMIQLMRPGFYMPATTAHTLDKCVLLLFDYGAVEQLSAKHASWGQLHAVVLWAYIEGLLHNIDTLRGKDASARYAHVMNRAGLARKVSQGDLASYLGISRETLNRIIKRSESAP